MIFFSEFRFDKDPSQQHAFLVQDLCQSVILDASKPFKQLDFCEALSKMTCQGAPGNNDFTKFFL